MDKWEKVFKNGPSKILKRLPSLPYPFNFLRDCLPQILPGLLLNTLSQMLELDCGPTWIRGEAATGGVL